MKLLDLFEETTFDTPLEPGEKRTRADLEARNIQAIQRKIDELMDSLGKSMDLASMFKQDGALQASLKNLSKRLELKMNYLERMKTRPTSNVDKMFDILDRQCSDFLAVLKQTGKVLYRGLRTDVSVFEGRSREDRNPQDSQTDVSNRLDQALRNNGFQALRSNSIFTTTSYNFASSYGIHVYCIFPKNGFHVLTTNVRDLILSNYEALVGTYYYDHMREFKFKLMNWLEDNLPFWRDTTLGYEIKYEHYDSMFRTVKSNFDEGNPLKLPDEFNKTQEDFVTDEAIMKHLEPRSEDLENARRDGREILISGEYWALRMDQWKKYIAKRYGVEPYIWD